MRRIAALSVCVCVLTAWATELRADPPGPGNKALLRLQLDKGKTYRIRVSMDQQIEQTLPENLGGQKQTVKQQVGMTYSFAVTDVDANGVMTCDVKFDAVKYKMAMPMMEIEYDSANPPEDVPAAAQGFAGLVGQGFRIRICPLGKVRAVEGVDKMLDAMFKKMQLPEGAMRQQLEKQMKAQFGDEGLKEMMEKMTAIYPKQAVDVGDSWTVAVDVQKMVAMKLDQTFTLKSRKDGVATLDVKTTITPNKNAEPMKMGPMTMTYEMKGTQTGTMEMDESNGWTRSAKLKQDFSGTMKMKGVPNQDELNIPMSIKGTVTMETVK